MKSQISYKAKRNIAIVLVIAIIAVLVSVGFYFFMKSNDETQAMSHTNGTSTDKAGEEIEQAQANNGEQDNNESKMTKKIVKNQMQKSKTIMKQIQIQTKV